MRSASVRRLPVLALATLVAVVALGAPAAAHGRGSESSNFDSGIVDAPELAGVEWNTHGGDQYLSVTNESDTEIVVAGYEGEPYLRVGPDGVWENLSSEATYVNAERYGDIGMLPEGVGPNEPPEWVQVSTAPTYAWHDHRIHWMSPALPPVVTDPGREVVIPLGPGGSDQWVVPFTAGGVEHEVTGETRYVPPPSPLPWLALAFVLTAPALLGLRSGRGPGWVTALARPAAAVLVTVSLLNVTHLVDDFLAVPLPLTTQLVSAVQTALFIALGLFGGLVAWRGRDGAFTALGVGSGGILIGQGLLYLDVLGASATASAFPDWVTRLVITLSLLQALWVMTIAVIGNRRLAAEEQDAPPVGEGGVPAAVSDTSA
jgi:hypothetical protein